jgi:hypothetical protein
MQTRELMNVKLDEHFGFEGRGRPLEFRLLHVLRFADDGQIAGEQVWLDSAAIAQQLA